MTSHQHVCLRLCFVFFRWNAVMQHFVYFPLAAVQRHPQSYEKHFKMPHQIPAAPVCSKSGPCVDLVEVGPRSCGPPMLQSSPVGEKKQTNKHASRFSALHHCLQETVFIALKICSVSVSQSTLLPGKQTGLNRLLELFFSTREIVLTDASFHNRLSGPRYLSTSRIPTPVLPLCRRLISVI